MNYIALYKGTPDEFWHKVMHGITCAFLSIRKLQIVKHSHAEMCIDGICYSSSVRDKGVRSKVINLNSGKWDLKEVQLTEDEKQYALNKFFAINGSKYDFLGAVGVVLPFVNDIRDMFFCFEVVAEMLGMSNQSKVTPVELIEYAKYSNDKV